MIVGTMDEIRIDPKVFETSAEDLCKLQKDDGKISPSISPTRRKRESWFVKFVPGSLIVAVAHLPGKALHVALAVYFQATVSRSSSVKLTPTLLRRFGVAPSSLPRILATLEKARTVRVVRKRGCCPIVTLRNVGENP